MADRTRWREPFRLTSPAGQPRSPEHVSDVGGGQGERSVILWVDTFSNHFHPEVAVAAKAVLEAAGFAVIVPARSLCCGRPLYDFGMLGTAKRLLRQVLSTLREEIRAGVPVVGLEPSCISVFRDELCNLFPHDEDAQRLKRQTFMLAEFLERYAPDFAVPRLSGKALVHGHCHHKAVLDMGSEERLLRKVGLDCAMPDDGCCGMAGAFGFERDKVDVSLACGERKLLPAVRAAPAESFIISNGFSCREQIAQTTGRRALHVAQVLQMALQGTDSGPYPERGYADHTARATTGATRALALAGVGLLTAMAARGLASARERTRP